MDIERFWDLIEQARATAGPAADQAVRDFDEPDDDPDRDYWDFDDLDVASALSAPSLNGGGHGDDRDSGGETDARLPGEVYVPPQLGANFAPSGYDDASQFDPHVSESARVESLASAPVDPSDASHAYADPSGVDSSGVDSSGVDSSGVVAPSGSDLDADDDFDDDEDGWDDEDEDDEVIDPIAVALLDLLSELSAEEIAAFDNIFEEQRFRAENDDVANAAILIEHGFLGDDSFDDFRAGLVALGRTAFEAAIEDPDTLADHPLVQEIATANDPRWLGREDMLFVASHAYAAVTGQDEVTFYDFAEGLREDSDESDEPDIEYDEWSVTDEEETRRRLPRLAELFYEKSMRNRKRAMDKLGLQE